MKKLLLLLITITTFTNISYASFPVADTLKVKQNTVQTETVEQYHLRMQKMGFDIEDCRCNDCKKFKGINNVKKKEIKFNSKTLFKTIGIWALILVAALVFLLLYAIWNAFSSLGGGPAV